MERTLDRAYTLLKVLAESGTLSYTDLIILASPKVGSAATVERTMRQCLQCGFVDRPEKGAYRLTERGRAIIKGLETPTT